MCLLAIKKIENRQLYLISSSFLFGIHWEYMKRKVYLKIKNAYLVCSAVYHSMICLIFGKSSVDKSFFCLIEWK